MRKSKLKIKKKPILILLMVILSPYLIKFYIGTTPYGKLRTLDYTKASIKLMDDELKEALIDKDIYDKTVEEAILEENFIFSNLDSYIAIDYSKEENFIVEINSLLEKGYNVDEIKKITLNLDFDETTYVIEHDYVENILNYINISYTDVFKFERYFDYQILNEDMLLEEVITKVNIGLDYDFYDSEIVSEVIPSGNSFVVNKYRYLDENYEPENLVKISDQCSESESFLAGEAAVAFETMCQASLDQGYSVLSTSAYRSYSDQQEVWDYYMKKNGPSYTYYYVAKPGYSEHQSGLALDLASGSNPGQKFAFTKDYTWTINNAHKYGFIIRYQDGTKDITGYNFEPWHIRYVGKDIAKYIYENDITLDEYMAQQ